MWRNIAKRAALRNGNLFSELPSFSSVKIIQDHVFLENITSSKVDRDLNPCSQLMGFYRIRFMSSNFSHSSDSVVFSGVLNHVKGYATAAEAIVSEEDLSGSEEIQELMEELIKEDKVESYLKQPKKMVDGMGVSKYNILRKRQIKMETEAWEEAAKEYQELLTDMCEQKLAPNLPYMKSLFLGWFEPLRDAIAADQEFCKDKKNRVSHAPYFDHLPADMMAVITMHKLMGLLMTNSGGNGSVRVVQAACQIGEAIEHEIRIHKFFEKTKKKNVNDKNTEGETDPVAKEQEKLVKEQEKLRKKVTSLMKKQKLHQVRLIVKEQDDLKPWGQDAHVKVGCRLIQLLMETAYIQPPVDQLGDGPPDIRPAFVHTLKTITKEAQKTSRRYGVIECDPLVRGGLEKTARHMVIPYMPMLIPPLNWTGYDKGAYLFLPSYVMRIHGAKQQREAVKRAPRKHLEPVFEVSECWCLLLWFIAFSTYLIFLSASSSVLSTDL